MQHFAAPYPLRSARGAIRHNPSGLNNAAPGAARGSSHGGMHEPGTQWQQWRLYHHAHYASKLRGRDIMAAGSTKDLQRLVRASGRK